MQWNGLEGFLAMGGYGAYVWGAYGVTVVLMIGEVVLVRRRHRAALEYARRISRLGKP